MKSTAKTVGLVMIIMIISRLMSLVSNQTYIITFGINEQMDIYSYVLQIPNIIFNSFGMAIVTVVIPIFAGHLGKGDKQKAFNFANNFISITLIFTVGLTILGMAFTPLIVLLTRFRGGSYNFAVTSLLILFPVIIFYSLNYIQQGILQSFGKYNMPAFVSFPSSVIVIAYVLLLGSRFGIKGLVIATFIGLASQALILIPSVYRTGYRYRPYFDFQDQDIKKALSLIGPVFIGTSAYQFNMLFNTVMAAHYPSASSLMKLVQDLILYGFLAFVYSVTAVVFPKLSVLAAQENMQGFKQSLNKVLNSALFILVPAAAGCFAVRYQLVDFLYGWGSRITKENLSMAGNMLSIYALGGMGIGVKEIVNRAFYSLKDTKKSAYNSVIIMITNIAFSIILVFFIGVYAIPFAYTISSLLGAFLILMMIRKKVGAFGMKRIYITFLKLAASSIVMLIVILPLSGILSRIDTSILILNKAIRLFVPAGTGAVIYFVSTIIFKVKESHVFLSQIKSKFGFLDVKS